MITIRELTKHYADAGQQQVILDNLNLDIPFGQSISIQGASGSGKSTLLHLMAALDKPDQGSINIQTSSNNLTSNIVCFTEAQADVYRQKHIGMIFQKFNLIDCVSVQDNILLPAQINHNIDEHYINELVSLLGIKQHLHKLPSQLSGGEQQRVAIARGLAHKPLLLLADEPTGNLDNKNAQNVSHLLIDTCRQLGTTLVMVTHSALVASLTSQQYIFNEGQLSLLEGSHHIYKTSHFDTNAHGN